MTDHDQEHDEQHDQEQHDDHHNGDDDGHRHPVTILVNRKDVHLPDDHATGGEIKHAADLPEAFKLFDPDGNEIDNDERIKLRDHEKFTAISGQDVS